MKILVGGIYHESHSFSNVPTDLEAFKRVLLLTGQECIEQLSGTESEMAGFISGAERFGYEVIPTVWAWGVSAGPVRSETLDHLIEIVKREFEKAERVDGILFALHGAMISEQTFDGDGYVLSRFREFAGETPIVITLDLHANISDLIVEKSDAIVGYDTYPHIDQAERGLEAAEILVRTIRREIRPTMALEKPSLVIVPNMLVTDDYPMKELLSLAHETESEGNAISVSIAGGFAYSDVPEIGPAVLVITDNDSEAAQKHARRIAQRFHELKKEFDPQLLDLKNAVKDAIASNSFPVILADIGDNIGAGTPGDGTFLLQELLEQQAGSAVVIIADEESVGKAIDAGVGNVADLSIGGKCDKYHGDPVKLKCRVRLISDGIFVNRGQMRDGIIENMGRTAVVEYGSIKIILTTIKMPPWNLEQLRSVGISPENEKIIALKSAIAFRAAYGPIAGKIIDVNSPGLSAVDLTQFKYKNIRRPLYPFDNI